MSFNYNEVQPIQQEIINCDKRYIVVLAGRGTGKEYITNEIAKRKQVVKLTNDNHFRHYRNKNYTEYHINDYLRGGKRDAVIVVDEPDGMNISERDMDKLLALCNNQLIFMGTPHSLHGRLKPTEDGLKLTFDSLILDLYWNCVNNEYFQRFLLTFKSIPFDIVYNMSSEAIETQFLVGGYHA